MLELDRRLAYFSGIAEGKEINDIEVKSSSSKINQTITYTIIDETLVLNQELSFSLNGVSYQLDQIPLDNPNRIIGSLCIGYW
jgi:hypothetical protein